MAESFSFPAKKRPDQTWEEILAQSHAWQILPRQKRSAFLAKARKMDRAQILSQQILATSSTSPLETPEEMPFVVADGMTLEEATVEKIRRDAEAWPIQVVAHITEIRASKVDQIIPRQGQNVFRGPRGGKYRIDNNGKKRYDI